MAEVVCLPYKKPAKKKQEGAIVWDDEAIKRLLQEVRQGRIGRSVGDSAAWVV